MRPVLCLCALWALALPATAQTPASAPLSPLDAAVFANPPASWTIDPGYRTPPSEDGVRFVPILGHYAPNILERFREVRRYGGRLSVPFVAFGTKLVFEGEGARDYGPNAKKLDIGRLRISKEFGDGYSAGFELGAYRGSPDDLRFEHVHVDRAYALGIHLTKSR